MIDPLTINPLVLPSLPLEQRAELPAVSAIYFCLNQSEEVLYIGRSINIAQR